MSILIAYNLEKYRKSQKMTQRKLSSELQSVSKSAITLYEKNQRTPSLEIQEKICKVLGITLDTLNGQEQKNILTNTLKKSLLDDKISANEYQYIYNYFSHFFDNTYYFSLKNANSLEYEKRAKNYLKRTESDIYTYVSGKHIENERIKIIEEKLLLFLNNFICFSLILKERLDNYTFLTTNVPIIKNFDVELDIEFFKIFVELKSVYIEILTNLNTIYTTKDISIAMYFQKIDNIIGYVPITAELKKDNSILLAIKIDSNFMSPKFDKDDIIILKEHKEYKDEQFIAIVDESNNILVGKLKFEKDFIILQPINLSYAPIVIPNGKFKFLGEIIETRYNNDNNK